MTAPIYDHEREPDRYSEAALGDLLKPIIEHIGLALFTLAVVLVCTELSFFGYS